MRDRASAIPAALDALVDGLRDNTALQQPRVDVLDGAPVSAIAGPSTVLIIGGTGDDRDTTATRGQIDEAGMGRGDDSESFDISCHIEHWQGGDNTRTARRAAFAVLNLVKAHLVADQTLGGTVTRARLTGPLEHASAHYEGDTGIGIPFTIRCRAL